MISQTISATGLLKAYKTQEATPREFIFRQAAEVDRLNKVLNAFARVNDKTFSQGEGLLAGVPVAVGDNIIVQDMPTGGGSASLAAYAPPFEASSVNRLKKAGAFILGKTNVDELGLGQGGFSSVNGPAISPWPKGLSAGGPQGGAAAALAAGLGSLALVSDTGADIAETAGRNGLFALAPTYGLISRQGLLSAIPSMERISFFSRGAEDLKLALDILAGRDEADSSQRPAADIKKALLGAGSGPENIKIGVLAGEDFPVNSDSPAGTFWAELKKAGLEIVEINIPGLDLAAKAYGVLAAAEAYSSWMRLNGVTFGQRALVKNGAWPEILSETRNRGWGEATKELMLWGALFLSEGYYETYLKPAAQIRALVKRELAEAFGTVDFIASVANPGANRRVVSPAGSHIGPGDIQPYDVQPGDVWETFTSGGFLAAAAALAGAPVLAVPGPQSTGSPSGLAFCAAPLADGRLLNLALTLEALGAVFSAPDA